MEKRHKDSNTLLYGETQYYYRAPLFCSTRLKSIKIEYDKFIIKNDKYTLLRLNIKNIAP